MTTLVNTVPVPTPPIGVHFSFEEDGPPLFITYDGDTFPYTPLPELPEGYPSSKAGADVRYKMGSTAILIEIVFTAEVTVPVGVEVQQYLWDFGDGTEGFGPIVSHQFETLNPNLEVTLTVRDSDGRLFNCTRHVTLVSLTFGFLAPNIVRGYSSAETSVGQIREAKDVIKTTRNQKASLTDVAVVSGVGGAETYSVSATDEFEPGHPKKVGRGTIRWEGDRATVEVTQ